MEHLVKPCSICNGACEIVIHYDNGKKYTVLCSECGNESDLKRSKVAVIKLHNQTSVKPIKSFNVGAPDAQASFNKLMKGENLWQ